MKLKNVIVSSVCLLMCSATLNAATLIEFANQEGEVIKMWIEGNKLRSDAEGGYVIMDWDAGKWYFVNVNDGMAMDLSAMMAAKSVGASGGGGSDIDASVDKVGDGPTIAGYDTVHYRVSVEGEHCQDVFVSAKALRDIGSEDIFDRLQSMDEDDESDYGWGDPCDDADQALDYSKVGLPMRTENVQNGEVDEIRRIELGAALPEGGFGVPAGMQIMDMSQMMQMMQNED